MAIHTVAGLLRQGVIGMGGEPFLDVGLIGGLEVIPFVRVCGLDLGRAKACGDGQVDEIAEVVELGG
jgi:hypothetical protein